MSSSCCQPPPCSFFKTEPCLGRCYLPRHKCLSKKEIYPGRVPSYMGWRYNAADSPEHQRRCGWRPGHVSCTVLRKIENRKKSSCYNFCNCGNCTPGTPPLVAENPPQNDPKKDQECPSIKITRHEGKYTIATSPQTLTTEPWSTSPLKYVIDTDEKPKDDLADPPIKYAIEGRYNDYRFDFTSSTTSFVIDFTPPSKSCCVKTCGGPCEGPCCLPCGECSELPCLPCAPCSRPPYRPKRRKPKRRKRSCCRPCTPLCCIDPCEPPPCGGCGTCATCLPLPRPPCCARCRPPPMRLPDSCDPPCTPIPNPKCSVAVAPSCCYSIPCLPTCCPLNISCAPKPCCPSGERSSKPCANKPCCPLICNMCGQDPCVIGPCCPKSPRRRRSKPRRRASRSCCRVPKASCKPKCVRLC